MSDRHRTLTTSEEIEAYLHKTRMAMLRVLRDGPATGSQIAARMGVHAANLTRHLRILERVGLVQLVEKRDTGRQLEKYYAATAQSFDVAPDAAALTAPHKIALSYLRSDVSAALAELPDDQPGAVQVLVVGARLQRQHVHEFAKAVADLAARFEAADAGAGESYHLALALYPGEVPSASRVTLARQPGKRSS